MVTASGPLAGVPEPWPAAFALAWESHRLGSPGVGAVIVDAQGSVISGGRSRRTEQAAVPNQLSGSRLAHAEINALAGLAVDQHDGLTMYTTLEPCLLCAAAIAIAHIPTLRFAGEDPVWRFLQGLPAWDRRIAERWPTVQGPLEGAMGSWATLVPLLERLERNPYGARVEELEASRPRLVALARELIRDGTTAAWARMCLAEAMDTVWARLPD
jgi:tRNA(Arg) A34 adenosine deaminase TadA